MGQSFERLRLRSGGGPAPGRSAGQGGRVDQCRTAGDRLYKRRHRKQQRRPALRAGHPPRTPALGHDGRRASVHPQILRVQPETGLRRYFAAGGPGWGAGPGVDGKVHSARHRHRVGDVGEQRDGRALPDSGDSRPLPRKGVPCHTDAVQAAGKLHIDVKASGVDFLSLSAHKLCGPKGVGLLYVKRHTKYQPYLMGGGQERGRRGGTENVPGIVGFGRAAELALANLESENTRVRALRDGLENGLLSGIPGVARNGAPEPRLPNTANLAFEGVEAEGLLLLLDQAGICASSGSACSSGAPDPSHVLRAMGCGTARSRGSIRFSLGIDNTKAEVEYVLQCLPGIVAKLRAQSEG